MLLILFSINMGNYVYFATWDRIIIEIISAFPDTLIDLKISSKSLQILTQRTRKEHNDIIFQFKYF